jgi:hypothetical protein
MNHPISGGRERDFFFFFFFSSHTKLAAKNESHTTSEPPKWLKLKLCTSATSP